MAHECFGDLAATAERFSAIRVLRPPTFCDMRATVRQKARLPVWVKLRKTQCEQMFSELPLKADIARCSRLVSKVPTVDIAACPNNVGYYPRRKAQLSGPERAEK